MYGYIYETTNLINNKKYIGKHKSSFFDKTYYGSGKSFKKDLEKYGKENFIIKIIEIVEDLNSLNDRETYYIELFDAVRSPKFYNNSYGGEQEGWQGVNRMLRENKDLWRENRKKSSKSLTGRVHSKEWRDNISKSLKGKFKSDVHREHLRNAKKSFTDEQKHRLGLNFGTFGKPSPIKGKTIYTSDRVRRSRDGEIRTKSSKEWKETIGLQARKKLSQTRIKQGLAKGKNNPMYGTNTVYISNIKLNKVKRIDYCYLEEYLLNGWIKGNIHKMKK